MKERKSNILRTQQYSQIFCVVVYIFSFYSCLVLQMFSESGTQAFGQGGGHHGGKEGKPGSGKKSYIPQSNGELTLRNNPNGQRGLPKCQNCRFMKQRVISALDLALLTHSVFIPVLMKVAIYVQGEACQTADQNDLRGRRRTHLLQINQEPLLSLLRTIWYQGGSVAIYFQLKFRQCLSWRISPLLV